LAETVGARIAKPFLGTERGQVVEQKILEEPELLAVANRYEGLADLANNLDEKSPSGHSRRSLTTTCVQNLSTACPRETLAHRFRRSGLKTGIVAKHCGPFASGSQLVRFRDVEVPFAFCDFFSCNGNVHRDPFGDDVEIGFDLHN
jgi:hypothetical protein